MKKSVFITALLMCVSASSFAQVSVEAGYVNSSHKMTVSGTSTSGNTDGLYVGASWNFASGNVLGVAPGVYYEFLTTDNYELPFATGSVQEHYMNIPVLLNAGVNFGDNVRAFVYAGPTLNYGIAATTSVDSGIGKGGNRKKQNLYSDSDYKRFDVLVGGGAGVELMHRLRFSVGYNAGLLNRTSAANSTLKRNQLHIGAAFVF